MVRAKTQGFTGENVVWELFRTIHNNMNNEEEKKLNIG